MLTIRFDALGLQPGDAVLDVGSGFGRHVYECARRGARVVALDYAADEVIETRNTLAAMVESGEITADRLTGVLRGDARTLPFPDDTFDVVITSEVLEHIQDDVAAIGEMVRVLQPRRSLRGHGAGAIPGDDQLEAERRVPRARRRRAATFASTHAPNCRPSCAPPVSTSTAITAPTPCTRRTGGCAARSARRTRPIRRW